jgi:hypothetical protein
MSTMTKQGAGAGRAGSRIAKASSQRPDVSAGSAGAPARAAVERVQARAYEIYRSRTQRGGRGDALSDWLQAEREQNSSAEIEAKDQARGEKLLASGK